MKICIFFDGPNFYRSLQRLRREPAGRLRPTGGVDHAGRRRTGHMFGGAYYYVGLSDDAPVVV